MARVYNFSAGPAMMPTAVMERAQAEMLDWHGTGMSIMANCKEAPPCKKSTL